MWKKTCLALFVLSLGVLHAADDFNVKNFGASGDGTADDAPAIQKAIDAALTNGGAVYFPAGRYRLKSTLTIAGSLTSDSINWLTLRGDGGGSKLLGDGIEYILAGRANPDTKSLYMNGARIENLTFSSYDFKNRCSGIDASFMLRMYITSCNFIRLNSGIASVRERAKPEERHSIWIVRIADCIFSRNSDWPINIRRAFDLVIQNNVIEHGNGGIQIGFEEDAADAACNTLRIENNVIEGLNASGKAAVRLRCVVGGRIVGNYFEANPGGDVEIMPKKGGWTRGFVIASNTFQPTKKQQDTGIYGPIKLEKAIDTSIYNNFTTGPRLLHSDSKPLGRNVVMFGNTMNNPHSMGFEGANEQERKLYEQAVRANEMNCNRFILSDFKEAVGIDSNRGIVFGQNAIAYADAAPKTGTSGDIVFSRKPEMKNGKVVIGWYCIAGGKAAKWLPVSIDGADDRLPSKP
ncbi:MAG: Pectate lyase superfamily protein [Lentisphaerae bacterium ADurb.Bin242]|nr:MAG: Pectate lyase superfamily protein [Lentisphaerae bacterium ADurb.Bin242]